MPTRTINMEKSWPKYLTCCWKWNSFCFFFLLLFHFLVYFLFLLFHIVIFFFVLIIFLWNFQLKTLEYGSCFILASTIVRVLVTLKVCENIAYVWEELYLSMRFNYPLHCSQLRTASFLVGVDFFGSFTHIVSVWVSTEHSLT